MSIAPGRAALLLALWAWLQPAASAAEARLVIARADGVRVWFDVELARDEATRRQGLMGRTRLAPRSEERR
ncbi:MAG: hypothetical protein RLW62_22600, partial [Gammaproteobacteria bacterium]